MNDPFILSIAAIAVFAFAMGLNVANMSTRDAFRRTEYDRDALRRVLEGMGARVIIEHSGPMDGVTVLWPDGEPVIANDEKLCSE